MDLTNRPRQPTAWPTSRTDIPYHAIVGGRSKPGSAETGTKLARACSSGTGSAASRDLVTNVARLLDTLEGGTAQASRARGLARTGAGMFSALQWPVP